MNQSIAALKRRQSLLRRGIKANLAASSQATRRAMAQNEELAQVNEEIEKLKQEQRCLTNPYPQPKQ